MQQINPNDKPLILIVDDDYLQREVIQATLEVAGYDIITANNGTVALGLVHEHSPDLILLDLRMDGIDGFEVCCRLKSDILTDRIPIIIISGLERDEDQRRAIEAGASDFLSKPFNRTIMLNRIHTLVYLKQLHDFIERRDLLLARALKHTLTDEDMRTIEVLLQTVPHLEPPNLSFDR